MAVTKKYKKPTETTTTTVKKKVLEGMVAIIISSKTGTKIISFFLTKVAVPLLLVECSTTILKNRNIILTMIMQVTPEET